MNKQLMITATVAVLAAPAMAGYDISQGTDAPTYTDRVLNFDEPGGPTGVVPADAWLASHGVVIEAGDGLSQVDDWDAAEGGWGLGDGLSYRGGFGAFMTFDSDVQSISFEVWDPSGPPSPFGGGIGIFLFNDGEEVASLFTEPAWGGLGDSWFDINATDGVVFDEVRVLGYGFIPVTYLDNMSWDLVPVPGYEITQGADAPTYTDRALNFDEPGGPTGVVPADAWLASHGVVIEAGDGLSQVDDWDAAEGGWGLGDGLSYRGGFGAFMTFDYDVTAMSLQVWDPSGPPSPFGGGMGVFLFNDGEEVASFFTEPAWGGLGDPWINIAATNGAVFDEVRILGFGFIPVTYIDNLTWNGSIPGYEITQGADAPTYTDRALNFDEPGGPTGVVPADAWLASHGVVIEAGDGLSQVDDWDAAEGGWGLGDGLSYRGGFGAFMTFDYDVTAMSLQVWDPSGPPSPFGGGMGVFLFNDGEEVASFFTEPAWGGLGDPWINIAATNGAVFDEVRILGFGFIPVTYIDNLTWNIIVPPCPEDVDGNGTVDVDDLVAVILAWGTDDAAADLDGSGTVDVDDLVAVITAWGDCP